MKLRSLKQQLTDGSVLLMSLIFAAIAGVTLASYLMMTENQTVSVYRSQSWNTAMTISEAGVEDALQMINRYAGSFEENILPQWTNHAAAENWSTVGANVYYMARQIPYQATSGAWFTNSYQVWVTNINNQPEIFATATVPWTFHYASTTPSQGGMFAAVGVSEDTGRRLPPIQRNVHIKTKYGALWQVAMAAVNTIDLNGRNVSTDSFDSSDPNFSNLGQYPVGMLWRTRANGDVATTSELIDSLDVGNARVKGRVRTGPGDDTITIGPNGSVGSRAWVENGNRGIQDGWSATDFNVVFPPVVLPQTSWLEPVDRNVTVDGTNYQYVILSGGDYLIPSLTGSLLVNAPAGATVRMHITSSVTFSGQEVLRLMPTGAKVRIYMSGAEFSMGGRSYIDNPAGLAERFYFFGLPTCTRITFAGNANFYGAVYAPNADFLLGGGGNDIIDFTGGSVTKTVLMNGHYRFHYDEALAKRGPGSGYVPVAWYEK